MSIWIKKEKTAAEWSFVSWVHKSFKSSSLSSPPRSSLPFPAHLLCSAGNVITRPCFRAGGFHNLRKQKIHCQHMTLKAAVIKIVHSQCIKWLCVIGATNPLCIFAQICSPLVLRSTRSGPQIPLSLMMSPAAETFFGKYLPITSVHYLLGTKQTVSG